jgi:hypothetical protein
MRKRLVLLVCAALVLMVAVPAFAAVQNVKVSGDILARFVTRDHFDLTKDQNAAADETGVFNSAVRLRVDADLTDNVQTTIRLINERDWDEATNTSTDIDLDLAYVTLKEFLYSPLTVTLGRQELHFGNDMIIGDGVGNPNPLLVSGGIGTNQTTNYAEAPGIGGAAVNGDLALRKAFDAIRATLNYDPMVVDVVYAKIAENTVTGSSAYDDIDLFGLNAGYKFNDNWNTLAEGYIWNKIDRVGVGAGAGAKDKKTDTTYTIGARVSTNPNAKLNLQQEMAYQFGEKVVAAGVGRERKAWASQTMATLTPGWKHNPVIGLVYSYFSGDADLAGVDTTKTYHQWDPMFENQTGGHIINALFASSNCHNIDASLTIKPSFLEDVTLRTDYVYQLLAKANSATVAAPGLSDYSGALGNTYKGDTQSLGQELDMNLIYDYTEDVQIGILTGWFWPGYAFTNAGVNGQDAVATETMISCNVKF